MAGERFSNYDGRLETQNRFPEIGRQYFDVKFDLHKSLKGKYELRATLRIPNTEFVKFYLILHKDHESITEGKSYNVFITGEREKKSGAIPSFWCKVIKPNAK